MTDEQRVQQYLSTFRAQLRATTTPESEEIIREINAHIRDAAEEPGATIPAVLTRLGSPQNLARQYGDGALLRRARGSISPLLLLQAALRLATKGVLGIVLFTCAVSGYITGGVLVLSALAKPLFPSRIGMWQPTPHDLTAGMASPPVSPVHEVLGWWYIPLALLIGALLIGVTTLIVRACLWTSQRSQRWLGGSALRDLKTADSF